MGDLLRSHLEQLQNILQSPVPSRHLQASYTVQDIFNTSLDVPDNERGKSYFHMNNGHVKYISTI